MRERFLEDVRSCIGRYAKAAGKGTADQNERLLKEIHLLCCLLADKDNGTGISPLRTIARNLAALASGCDETAATIYDFGSGFALLRASAFQETIPQFEKIRDCRRDSLRAIELAASCFGCVAASLGGEVERARLSLRRAKLLVEGRDSTAPCEHGLVAMAQASLLYKTGDHVGTIKLVEHHRDAFASGSAPLNSKFPYFQAQALLTQAKALRDIGKYADALDLLYHERKLRALINDLLGQVWSLLEEARIRRFRREFENAEICLGLANHYVAGTDLHEYRARIADQRGDIHCSRRELDKAEANYKLAQETADASGQLWLQAHVGNSIARLRLLQGRPAEARRILESFESVWNGTKNYGKYLYLFGRAEAELGNYGDAEQTYRDALESLKSFGLSSIEALTRDRLAQLLMKLGRKEEACVEWARALKLSETVQAVRLFEEITRRYVNQVKAEDLLPIVEEAMLKRMEMQARIEGSHLRLGRAEDLIWREHYVLAHWFVQPVWEMLRSEDRNAVWLPPVILEFCKIFGNPVWLSRMLTGDLSTPAEEVDIVALCEQSLERLSGEVGKRLSLSIAVERAKVQTDEYILRQALDALFRGLYSGFGTTAFELSQRPAAVIAQDEEVAMFLALKGPIPEGFSRASELVRINVALKDVTLRSLFDRGYSGDLTLADFLIGVVLGERLSFHLQPPTVEIAFQTRHKRLAGRFPPSQVVDLLYQQHMAESIILFIEDELDHFEAVREHLEPDFKCARSHGLQIEMVAEEIEDLRPVVVVLDLMLFSSHRAAKAGMAACRRSIALLESRLGNKLAPTRPTRREDDSNETPVMASDWLRELKGLCPGVPVVAFSQLEATAHSLGELVADAIAKRLDMNARLVNGKEIAEKVRQLIKG